MICAAHSLWLIYSWANQFSMRNTSWIFSSLQNSLNSTLLWCVSSENDRSTVVFIVGEHELQRLLWLMLLASRAWNVIRLKCGFDLYNAHSAQVHDMQTTDENSVFLYDFYLATFILPISIIRVVWLWCPVLGLVLFRDNIPLQPTRRQISWRAASSAG